MSKPFQRLGDECDTKEWARKADDDLWIVIKIIKLKEITGDDEFIVQVGYIELEDVAVEESLAAFGWLDYENDDATKVLAMVENHFLDVQWERAGAQYLTLLMDAFNYANSI